METENLRWEGGCFGWALGSRKVRSAFPTWGSWSRVLKEVRELRACAVHTGGKTPRQYSVSKGPEATACLVCSAEEAEAVAAAE